MACLSKALVSITGGRVQRQKKKYFVVYHLSSIKMYAKLSKSVSETLNFNIISSVHFDVRHLMLFCYDRLGFYCLLAYCCMPYLLN
jgi:hypothetical protein